jgi:pimeloyl-ACP methyl ester carboxylesterase
LILANFAALHQETWRLAECARITAPTLGVLGEDSPPLVQHLTRLIASQITDAKVTPVAAAGHMLPMTHASQAAKLIGTHLLAAEAQAAKPRAA